MLGDAESYGILKTAKRFVYFATLKNMEGNLMKIDAETYQKLPENLKALFQKAANPSSEEVVGLFPCNQDVSSARFFYCAKASKRDRDEGLDGFDVKCAGAMDGNSGRSGVQTAGDGITPIANPVRANAHPTVKPTELMRYLCRLVTPPGGIVLDPFMGSGSTGKGAILEGFRFIGIEREAEFYSIAQARIEHATKTMANTPEQTSLPLD